jgi:hypothetical protein
MRTSGAHREGAGDEDEAEEEHRDLTRASIVLHPGSTSIGHTQSQKFEFCLGSQKGRSLREIGGFLFAPAYTTDTKQLTIPLIRRVICCVMMTEHMQPSLSE